MATALTIDKVIVSMGDSGFGGPAATYFEFHKMLSGSLPASPPAGVGSVTSVIVPAAGANVMSTSSVSGLSAAFSVDDYLIVTVRDRPTTIGNFATITIKAT
jgi:hypothetical protein